MRILVSGPTGSGKTTQATLLSKYLRLPFIGVGRMLRDEAEKGTNNGLKVQIAMKKGTLVDDAVVARVVKKRVGLPDCQDGFIMDGFPRSLSQLKHFDPNYDHVFSLDISDKEAAKRLLKRGREDDTPALIKKRLEIYHRFTEPVLSWYMKKGILDKVNGEMRIEKVHQTIKERILKK